MKSEKEEATKDGKRNCFLGWCWVLIISLQEIIKEPGLKVESQHRSDEPLITGMRQE